MDPHHCKKEQECHSVGLVGFQLFATETLVLSIIIALAFIFLLYVVFFSPQGLGFDPMSPGYVLLAFVVLILVIIAAKIFAWILDSWCESCERGRHSCPKPCPDVVCTKDLQPPLIPVDQPVSKATDFSAKEYLDSVTPKRVYPEDTILRDSTVLVKGGPKRKKGSPSGGGSKRKRHRSPPNEASDLSP